MHLLLKVWVPSTIAAVLYKYTTYSNEVLYAANGPSVDKSAGLGKDTRSFAPGSDTSLYDLNRDSSQQLLVSDDTKKVYENVFDNVNFVDQMMQINKLNTLKRLNQESNGDIGKGLFSKERLNEVEEVYMNTMLSSVNTVRRPADNQKLRKMKDQYQDIVETRKQEKPGPTDAVPPPKCPNGVSGVIIGGGYAGSLLSTYLDSILNLTLVDTKNYFELFTDLVPLLCSKWCAESDRILKEMLVLHRFYLKNANIITGRASSIDLNNRLINLADNRSIMYDTLCICTGKRKAFPFYTASRTKTQRYSELKHLNHYLFSNACNCVAVIGGGPLGVSVATFLSSQYLKEDNRRLLTDSNHKPKQIYLITSHPTLLPRMPYTVQRYVVDIVQKQPNLTLLLNTEVTDIEKQNLDSPVSTHNAGLIERLQRLFSAPRVTDPDVATQIGDKFRLCVAPLVGGYVRQKSVLHQLIFKENKAPLFYKKGTPQRVPGDETKLPLFDYVFLCMGTMPQNAIVQSLENQKHFMHGHSHTDSKGRVVINRFCQLLGLPQVFAIGSCNNNPFDTSLYNTKHQVLIMGNMFHYLWNTPKKAASPQIKDQRDTTNTVVGTADTGVLDNETLTQLSIQSEDPHVINSNAIDKYARSKLTTFRYNGLMPPVVSHSEMLLCISPGEVLGANTLGSFIPMAYFSDKLQEIKAMAHLYEDSPNNDGQTTDKANKLDNYPYTYQFILAYMNTYLQEYAKERQLLLTRIYSPRFYKKADPTIVREKFNLWKKHEVTDIADFIYA